MCCVGKTLFAVGAMYRKEYGIRDAHRKIHIISPHAVSGEFNNALDPIINEAAEDPDGKFILEPVKELKDAERIVEKHIKYLEQNPPKRGDHMDLFFFDDFGTEIRSAKWLMRWLTKCSHPSTGFANVVILVQMASGIGGLPPAVITVVDYWICNASCNKNTKVRL